MGVLLLPGTYELGYRLTLCIGERSVSAALVPGAGIECEAGAALTIIIAEAGIKIRATIFATRLVPTIKLQLMAAGDIKTCLLFFIEMDPLTIALIGYFSVLACPGLIEVCADTGTAQHAWYGAPRVCL